MPEPPSLTSMPQARVLLVGDFPAPADRLAERVARLGVRLESFLDPEEVLAALERGGPAVVVVSASILEPQALDLAIRVRGSPQSGQVALVIEAATRDPELELRAYQEGVDVVLPIGTGAGQIAARIQGQLRRFGAGPVTAISPAMDPADAAIPDVVVVEDDPGMAEMLRYTLEGRGYRVTSYRDGPRALAELTRLRTGSHRPVVLLDVDLPGLDGFRILETLSQARPGDYQIVLCTVHRSEAAQVLGIQSGAVDYLVKPLQMPVVLAKVDRLLALAISQ